MNQPSGRLAATHRDTHQSPSGPVVVTVSGRALTRMGLCAAALALIVLPALALMGSGRGAGSPTLVDQQLDGIVQAGTVAPTTDPVSIPAADMPLPLSPAAAPGSQPTASLTVIGPRGTGAPIASSAFLPGSSRGIPLTVLAAYRHAADVLASSDPGCGLPWWLLAGIGRIESGHAAGGHVDASGTTIGRIVGPRLDGSTPGTAIVHDTDHGALDGDPLFDRAVGPMQFLPSTWASIASDGNGDGRKDPNNIYDAALGAARYLCADGANLGTDAGLTAAVMKYNPSATYVADVLSWGRAYRDDVTPLADAAGPIPTARPDTAPVVAPRAGAQLAAGPSVPRRSTARNAAGSPITSNPAPTHSPVAPGSSGSSASTPTTSSSSTCSPTTGATPSASPTSTTSTPSASPTTTTTTATTPTTTSPSTTSTSNPPPSC